MRFPKLFFYNKSVLRIHNIIYDVIYDLIYDLIFDVIHDVIYDLMYEVMYNIMNDKKTSPGNLLEKLFKTVKTFVIV